MSWLAGERFCNLCIEGVTGNCSLFHSYALRALMKSGHYSIPTAVECDPLADPENGQVSVPSRTFRSTAAYECDSGFVLVGVQTRECQANAEWSDEAPTCECKFQFPNLMPSYSSPPPCRNAF